MMGEKFVDQRKSGQVQQKVTKSLSSREQIELHDVLGRGARS
jgi:hypothetical protein